VENRTLIAKPGFTGWTTGKVIKEEEKNHCLVRHMTAFRYLKEFQEQFLA